jgi:hypothetical protein
VKKSKTVASCASRAMEMIVGTFYLLLNFEWYTLRKHSIRDGLTEGRKGGEAVFDVPWTALQC